MTEPTEVTVHEEAPPPVPAEVLPDQYRDMAVSPDQFKRRREALLLFINDQLVPAELDSRGKIVTTNDYYKLPGQKKWALSKKGAESLGVLYRYVIADSEIVAHECGKDYCYARARVKLHRSNILVAVQEASCSSAEKSFQNPFTWKKYTIEGKQRPDWRAADNDICARAQKRAYVRCMIAACGASDILEAADGFEVEAEAKEIVVPTPASKGGPRSDQVMKLGQLVSHAAFTDEQREKLATRLNKPETTAQEVDEWIVRAEEKIEDYELEPLG